MDLTTNGFVITRVCSGKQEKLTMSIKEDENGKELKQPDYDEDKDQLEEKQEEDTG